MDLVDLHRSIVNKQKFNVYLFIGDEIFVRDQYILNIAKLFTDSRITRCNSVSDAMHNIKKPSIMRTNCTYIVSDDTSFIKDDKAHKILEEISAVGNNILILTFSSLDKRGKFYKQFKDSIVEFQSLSDDILVKYITNDIELSVKNITKLIDMCNHNYNRIRLEEDKIKQLSQAYNISCDTAFDYLVSGNVIYQDVGDITFKFTDSIAILDLPNIHKYLMQSKLIGEPPLLTLSVLYNQIKNIMIVQSIPANTKDKSKLTGLTSYQIKMAKDKLGIFSTNDLRYILRKIIEVEQWIKTGKIDSDIAIDYLLVSIA